MRTGVVGFALALLVLAPLLPRAASAQFSFDARRIGMGGVSLSRDGNARRYNPAYRAVKNKNQVTGAPKFSIPVPLGLIQFFHDHPINQLSHDPMFNPDSAAFNPIGLMDLVFNPPIFLEVKKAPTPTNDVEFTIGRNELIVDLGATKVLIPEQDFGLGSTSRLFDAGGGFAGFNIGVMGFLEYDVRFQLDTALRNFLVSDSTARPNTPYSVNVDGVAQAGLAPTVSFAGRILRGIGGDATDDGLYVGGALHYYLGATYGRAVGPAGFTTGNPVLASPPTPRTRPGHLRPVRRHQGRARRPHCLTATCLPLKSPTAMASGVTSAWCGFRGRSRWGQVSTISAPSSHGPTRRFSASSTTPQATRSREP